jgi:hypothetical protein
MKHRKHIFRSQGHRASIIFWEIQRKNVAKCICDLLRALSRKFVKVMIKLIQMIVLLNQIKSSNKQEDKNKPIYLNLSTKLIRRIILKSTVESHIKTKKFIQHDL